MQEMSDRYADDYRRKRDTWNWRHNNILCLSQMRRGVEAMNDQQISYLKKRLAMLEKSLKEREDAIQKARQDEREKSKKQLDVAHTLLGKETLINRELEAEVKSLNKDYHYLQNKCESQRAENIYLKASKKSAMKQMVDLVKENAKLKATMQKSDKFRSSMVEENIGLRKENAELKKMIDVMQKGYDKEYELAKTALKSVIELKARWEKLELKFNPESYYNGDRILAIIKELSPDGSDGGFHYCDYCKKTFPTLEEHEKHYQLKHKPKSEKSPNPEWWSVGDGIVIKKPKSGKFNWEERKEKA